APCAGPSPRLEVRDAAASVLRAPARSSARLDAWLPPPSDRQHAHDLGEFPGAVRHDETQAIPGVTLATLAPPVAVGSDARSAPELQSSSLELRQAQPTVRLDKASVTREGDQFPERPVVPDSAPHAGAVGLHRVRGHEEAALRSAAFRATRASTFSRFRSYQRRNRARRFSRSPGSRMTSFACLRLCSSWHAGRPHVTRGLMRVLTSSSHMLHLT